MFGRGDEQNERNVQRRLVPPMRKWIVTRVKPLSEGKQTEEIAVYGHNLDYAVPGVLAVMVAVEYEEVLMTQCQRILHGYIEVREENAAMPAESTLTKLASKLVN